jgi:hypothetical protein
MYSDSDIIERIYRSFKLYLKQTFKSAIYIDLVDDMTLKKDWVKIIIRISKEINNS